MALCLPQYFPNNILIYLLEINLKALLLDSPFFKAK